MHLDRIRRGGEGFFYGKTPQLSGMGESLLRADFEAERAEPLHPTGSRGAGRGIKIKTNLGQQLKGRRQKIKGHKEKECSRFKDILCGCLQ